MRIIGSFLILVCGICSGCMSGMKYSAAQENIWKLGFSETQLSDTVYRVTYNGYNIPASQAMDYALLRGAELCLSAGYSHFLVAEQNGQTTSSGGMLLPAGSAVMYASVNRPEVTLTIQFARDPSTGYSAGFIKQSLRKKYKLS